MKASQSPLALVTGASRGLGRLCAIELAKGGANLLLVARNAEALVNVRAEINAVSPRSNIDIFPCDLGDAVALANLRASIEARGGIDILINNAAVQGPIGNSWDITPADFATAMRLDFLVPVELSQIAIPFMQKKGRGWIVNISGGGATGPRPKFAAYGAAKTALVRFSETLAAEAAPFGIRVNAVAPGAFASGMTTAVRDAGAKAGDGESALADKLLAAGDEANAQKAAQLVAYLTVGDGRDVTGKLISAVWDRWDLLHQRADIANHKDVFTLRRIVPEERNLKLDE